MLSIYNGLVGSHLSYGVLIWGSAKACVLNKLQVSQNKIIRTMNTSPITQNIAKQLRALQIMNIKELHEFEIAKFMYNMSTESLPEVFSDYVTPISHLYNTRHRLRSHYELGTPKSDIGKSSVKFFGVKIWGDLGKDIQDAASIDVFKNMYKKALFEQ